MFVGDIINFPKTLWISFTVLSLIRPTKDEYLKRVETRLLYTIIGSLTFYLLFKFLIPVEDKIMVAFVVGFAMMFIDNYSHKTMANSFNALLTATIDLTNLAAVILRIISNIIGIVVASISQKIFEYFFRRKVRS